GHYRFGSRSATATVLIGAALLVLGVGLGPGATPVMALVPEPVVGALLVFSGLELALSARAERFGRGGQVVVALVAAVAVAAIRAVGFLAGLRASWGLSRRRGGTPALG